MPGLDKTIVVASASIGASALVGRLAFNYLRGKAPTEKPQYSQARSWFALEISGDKPADLFYAHPTTHVAPFSWNVAVEDMGSTCTGTIAGDKDLLIGHARAFDQCNVYAPKYRQMGFLSQAQNIATGDEKLVAKVESSIRMAADDLKAAFKHFLAVRPDKSRPFLVAGHSQGAIMLTRVLSQCVEGTEVRVLISFVYVCIPAHSSNLLCSSQHEKNFVAAYLAGAYCPMDLFGTVFKSIHACSGPIDIGCVAAWDTRTADFDAAHLNDIGFGYGLWAHHLHWLLHDKYLPEKPPPEKDDVAKPRLQVSEPK